MAFLDPYAVDGATVTGAHLRREVYRYTSGMTGVDTAAALRVQAVPGSPGVAGILPGGGVIAVDSRRESYSVTNLAMDGDALVDVPAAGSGGATHYVIIEVTDPEYDGQEPAATPRVVSSLSGRSRPFLPLARIRLAAGETFTTTSTVDDLRQVAMPRSLARVLHAEHTGPTETIRAGMTDLRTVAYRTVEVPEWATHATVSATFSGIALSNGDHAQGFAAIQLGNQIAGAEVRVDENWSGSWHRFTLAAGGEVYIPAAMRGTEVEVPWRLRHTNGAGRFQIDSGSTFLASIEFREQAD